MNLSILFSSYLLGVTDTLRWDLFFQPLPIVSLTVSLGLAALLWIFWKKRGSRDILIGPNELGATNNSLKLFYGWVPLILGIHVAAALLINGIQGRLLSSTQPLEGSLSNWIGLAEITIALSLFYGGLTRPFAVLLGILWILVFNQFGLQATLESIQFIGYAAFFYLAGRGPYSIDRILFPRLEPSANYIANALLFLRIGVGLNLIVYAFTQKLANIPAVSLLLEHHKFLNFTTIPNEYFVLIAGSLELLAGILIILGVFPRTVSLITLVCINASLTIYNWNGLIDHMPLYGALAILLVWEPNNPQQKLIWVEGLRKNIPERPDPMKTF